MTSLITQAFNNLFTITNNPNDFIPYKYFIHQLNGWNTIEIDKLLNEVGVKKTSIQYNNTDNYYINLVNEGKYLVATYNPYRQNFIEKYTDKPSFKISTVSGIIEKTESDNAPKDTSDVGQLKNMIELLMKRIDTLEETVEDLQNEIISIKENKIVDEEEPIPEEKSSSKKNVKVTKKTKILDVGSITNDTDE